MDCVMMPLALIFVITFATSWGLTLAVRAAALRWGIVDYPDGIRKLHQGVIPLGGGVAVYLSMVAGLLAAEYGFISAGTELAELSRAIILAAGFVCFFGCIDDIFRLNPRFKLALQIFSVLPIVLVGYNIERIVAFGHRIELGPLGIPLTVFWLIGCINALNLLDGMDGLAGVVGLSTAAMLGLISANLGNIHVSVIAIVLAGALAGFLMLNRPPASIFLGDSGSMVIGLTVGVLGMQGTMKTSATLSIAAPVVVMTLPMLDIVAAVVRRALTGRRIDSPDRKHIHHLLLDRGLTPWQVLCILGAFCLATGGAATAATIFRKDALAWITALTLVVLMIRLKLFGHHEFALAYRAAANRLSAIFLRRQRRAGANEHITFAKTGLLIPQNWDLLIEEAKKMNIRRMEMQVSKGSLSALRRWSESGDYAEACEWWHSVSVQRQDDRACTVCVAAREKPRQSLRLDLFERMMQNFADTVVESVDNKDFFALMDEVGIMFPETRQQERKAA
jgi:UDP-GlcNAc:undecaprenyl-phosphate GlcNAc-1-phosphate transferase